MTTAATPNWRALVEACGADPGIVTVAAKNGNSAQFIVRINDIEDVRTMIHRWPEHGWMCVVDSRWQPAESVEAAVRAALDYLRAEVRRRRDEMNAALGRLGETNT